MTQATERIPGEHSTAILKGEEIIHSGMMADCRVIWDNLPFEKPSGLYYYIMKAINGKWYLHTWMQY